MITREERRALNKRAHAMRREATNADYRDAKQAGQSISWREVWTAYESMPNATVIAALTAPVVTVPEVAKVRRARKAPAHIAALSAEYRLAREAWQAGLDEAVAGGRTVADGGKPARGERYTDEERDYRAANPAPVWSAWLADMGARSVASQDVAA